MRYSGRPSKAKCIVNPLRPSLVDIEGDLSCLRGVTDWPIRRLQNLRGALGHLRTCFRLSYRENASSGRRQACCVVDGFACCLLRPIWSAELHYTVLEMLLKDGSDTSSPSVQKFAKCVAVKMHSISEKHGSIHRKARLSRLSMGPTFV
jgi:hypothetical protein